MKKVIVLLLSTVVFGTVSVYAMEKKVENRVLTSDDIQRIMNIGIMRDLLKETDAALEKLLSDPIDPKVKASDFEAEGKRLKIRKETFEKMLKKLEESESATAPSPIDKKESQRLLNIMIMQELIDDIEREEEVIKKETEKLKTAGLEELELKKKQTEFYRRGLELALKKASFSKMKKRLENPTVTPVVKQDQGCFESIFSCCASKEKVE